MVLSAPTQAASDAVLERRVRASLGRWTARPGAIDVRCSAGCVLLRGEVPEDELPRLLGGIGELNGVRQIDNRLGRSAAPVAAPPRRWSRSTRLLLAGGGAALALYGLRRHDHAGTVAIAAGALLALAGFSDRGRAFGRHRRDGRQDGIDVEQTILIAASPERLFALWSEGDSLPRFLSHVKEVRPLGDQRWHWIVEGPGGVQLEWISQLTDRVPPRLLAWRSLPDAEIEQSGRLRLEPAAGGGTWLGLRLSYRPPEGVLGHVVASLAGRRPREQLRGDLRRLKQFVEAGDPPSPAGAAAPRFDQRWLS